MSGQEREVLGARLKQAREYRGFLQEDVAKYVGIPRTAISLIESGARRVDAVELGKFARMFGCSTDELAGVAPSGGTSSSAQFIARAAADLTEEDRAEVIRFAEFLKARRTSGS